MSEVKYVDILGKEITEGDFIVYATSQGSSSAKQNLARIVEIIPQRSGKTWWDGESYIECPEIDYELSVEKAQIGRRRRRGKWNYGFNDGKPVRLKRSDHIVKVDYDPGLVNDG